MSTSRTTEQDHLRSRLPDPDLHIPEIAVAVSQATENGSLPRTTVSLVQLRLGQLIGSTHHTLQQTAALRRAGEAEERIVAVATWQDAPCFTAAERVALELVDALLIPNPFGEQISDELYARAVEHYDDKALLTLCMAIGRSCSSTPVTLVGTPVPGRPPGQNRHK